MAYPKYSYIDEKLYIVVDRVTVDNDLQLTEQINVFHGISQSNPSIKDYRTIRIPINEKIEHMAICAQIAQFNLIGQSKTRNLFFTLELSQDSNRHVFLNAVD